MKLGLLVECGRQGLEAVVCRQIAELLRVEHGTRFDLDIVPMDNKRRLIEECGIVTRNLLRTGCQRVIVLWDERPAWPDRHEKLCWHNDRERILSGLVAAGVAAGTTHLVCIEREFESWLLYDERMLACVLSSDAHPVRVPRQKRPDRMPNPKGTMTSLFRQLAGRTYVDVQYASRLAHCLQDLARLNRCTTFRRFAEAVVGTEKR